MTKSSGRGRHSFIQFYMSDWLAGTARMPRMARSVYFDVCVYNWDRVRPMPRAELAMEIGDMEADQAEFLVGNLIDSGKLCENGEGIYCERALGEGERALEAWTAKSRGGKGGKALPALSEDSSKSVPLEPEPEPEPDKKGGDSPPPPSRAKVSIEDCEIVTSAWNAMASRCEASSILKMSDGRTAKLKERIREHGVEALIEAIKMIPDSLFLTAKTPEKFKAHIDWFVQPDSLLRLMEGFYHRAARGGTPSGWVEE